MNTSRETAQLIKCVAKERKVVVKAMLDDLDFNKNTLSSMTSRGSWLQADSLAKIADYLDCSVDYLLGRTSKPTSESDDLSADEKRALALFARLDDFDKGIIIGRMEAALEAEKYKQDGLFGEKAM